MKKFWTMILCLLGLVACGGTPEETPAKVIDIQNLPDTVDVTTVAGIKDNSDEVLVIDVREQWEYDAGHIPGVTHIPMGEVASRLSEIPQDKEVILTCQSGNRSGQVTNFLREQGYDNVHNMSGGLTAWQRNGLPIER